MRVVIQCAGSKRADAGTFCTADGRKLVFVADPAAAPPKVGMLFARPDDPSDRCGQSWRDRVVEENRHPSELAKPLLTAGGLYRPKAYETLQRWVGAEKLFILSAGWGLVRSDFRLPTYNITFSGAAEPYKQRRKTQDFADFNALAELPGEDTVFLGGKAYLPLFLRLTATLPGKRLVFFNAASPPVAPAAPAAPGCVLQPFHTTGRTNWHYGCAAKLADGSLLPNFG